MIRRASAYFCVLLAGLQAAGSAIAAPGLDARPSNITCLAPARQAGNGSVSPNWLSTDVGAVAVAGSSSIAGNVLTLRGSGADIWNSADEFRFTYRQLTGDGDLIARIDSLTNTNAWAKAGVMLRESLSPGSRFALMLLTPGTAGAAFHYRLTTGGSAQPPSSGDGSSPSQAG